MKKRFMGFLAFLLLISMTSCGQTEPQSQKSLVRLDEDGYLYYMDYTADYYGPEVSKKLENAGFIDTGCSTFFTHNTDGDPITCRNYDYPHRVSDTDRSMTGLNVVLHCKPEGKYESIAVADAIWCDESNPLLRKGGPDEADFDVHMVDTIPYECMDGINETGLCVSILRVDIKEGDQPGKTPISSSVLLRHILDNCANVSEAVTLVETSSILPEHWQNCQFYVSDANGDYAVIQSRNSEVSVIESDVVTNFYLGSDDIEDHYKNGKLRESAIMLTDEDGVAQYQLGYGHGYHRFAAIAVQLRRYQDTKAEEYRTVMPESAALVTLQSAVQNPNTNASGISMTQYSVIYNNKEKTLKVWSFQDYQTNYMFDVAGNRLSNEAA